MPRSLLTGRAMPVRFLIVSAALIGLSGCTSATNVTGKVSFKGEPLSTGSITLVASDGAVYTTSLNTDGTFSIPNVPTGSVQIAVVGANRAAGTKPPPAARGAGGPAGTRGGAEGNPENVAPAVPQKGPVLPAELGDPRTSGLTGTVKAGQPLNIDIP